MRASGGTNFGLDLSAVAWTNSTIAFLAAPSFHEGSGSVSACARAPRASRAPTANASARAVTGFPPASPFLLPGPGVRSVLRRRETLATDASLDLLVARVRAASLD